MKEPWPAPGASSERRGHPAWLKTQAEGRSGGTRGRAPPPSDLRRRKGGFGTRAISEGRRRGPGYPTPFARRSGNGLGGGGAGRQVIRRRPRVSPEARLPRPVGVTHCRSRALRLTRGRRGEVVGLRLRASLPPSSFAVLL